MNSRERLIAALNHNQPDRVPVDFGSTAAGIHVAAVARVRENVARDKDYRVNVVEPYQMLGGIDEALRKALAVDVVGLTARKTMFGFENRGWKPFTLFDDTETMVPEKFNVQKDDNGDFLIHPEGERMTNEFNNQTKC